MGRTLLSKQDGNRWYSSTKPLPFFKVREMPELSSCVKAENACVAGRCFTWWLLLFHGKVKVDSQPDIILLPVRFFARIVLELKIRIEFDVFSHREQRTRIKWFSARLPPLIASRAKSQGTLRPPRKNRDVRVKGRLRKEDDEHSQLNGNGRRKECRLLASCLNAHPKAPSGPSTARLSLPTVPLPTSLAETSA